MPNEATSTKFITRLELAVVVAIVFVLICILLPAVQAARESARRMSCGNNFKQIGLGLQNYHAAYDRLPSGCGGTGLTPGFDAMSNQSRLSALVAIAPFMEASPLWEVISSPYPTGDMPTPVHTEFDIPSKGDLFYRDYLDELSTANGPCVDEHGARYFPAMGPAPWLASDYPMWQVGLLSYRCPTDPVEQPAKHAAMTNYGFCYGDAVHEVGYVPGEFLPFRESDAERTSQRGAFISGVFLRFDDFEDGLASTVLMAELVTHDGSRRAISSIAAGIAGLRDNPSACFKALEPSTRQTTRRYKKDIRIRLTPEGKMSRGGNWADGAISWTGFNTILPPNSPSCDPEEQHRLEGVFSAASLHPGGCHVLMGDGAVKFISDAIDTCNTSVASVYAGSVTPPDSPSPYGVWGSMGTRSSESKPRLQKP